MIKDNLEGKVAFVTGAGQGIGKACAVALAAKGAKVVVTDVDEGAAKAAAEEIGNGATSGACDVRDEAGVTAALAAAADQHGKLDVVVPNAGIGNVKPLAEMSYEQWREVTSINLDGVFLTAKVAAGMMAQTGGGSIVTIASITALTGCPGIGHYAAAKAGALSVAKTISAEMRGFGIRSNAVLPAFIGTPLVTDVESDFDALLPGEMTLQDVIAMKQTRWGQPEDVAKAVVFLAGDRSGWINGIGLTIDGGFRASVL